jgi:AcrR family transcriptional regulator
VGFDIEPLKGAVVAIDRKDAVAQPRITARERRRDARAHRAILDATNQLLGEGGYAGLTIEGVAARAGVGKATVYRWWPAKGAIVIEALADSLTLPPPTETGDLRQDLRAAIDTAIHTFAASPTGAVLPALAAELSQHAEMAEQFRVQILRPRRSAVVGILRRAAARGDLPPDVDAELLLDIYAGAVFYRVFLSGQPVTEHLADQLVSLLLDGQTPIKPRADASLDTAG